MLVFRILNKFKKLFIKISKYFIPITLSKEAAEFVKYNKAFWERYFPNDNSCKKQKFILVMDERHPLVSLSVGSFAFMVARAKGSKILLVSHGQRDEKKIRILSSYPCPILFHFLRGLRYYIIKKRADKEALKAYNSIKTPREILEYEVDGICFGDILYDAILAGGYATIDKVDSRLLDKLKIFHFYRYCVKDIIRRYDISVSLFGHLVGMRGGVFSRYLLKYGIQVIQRVGGHQIVVKKYNKFEDMGVYTGKLEPKYFHSMMANDDGTIIKLVDEYFELRAKREAENRDVALAYDQRKKTFTDKHLFCAEYGLDDSKPVVFVMLHAFNDYPHSHFSKPMIFQDYFRWFLNTLKIAQEIKEVNWIFKEHPAIKYYPTKDTDARKVFKDSDKFSNIRFLDSDVNFNSHSIKYLASAVITCIGTAGLEHSIAGIPCILAGESPYSGFGFTIEPAGVQQYRECMENINQLKPLSQMQIAAAKTVAYFFLCLYNDGCNYYFCPKFDYDTVYGWNETHSRQLWSEAASQFQDEPHVNKMKQQVADITQFLLDESRTQYFDMSRVEYLKTWRSMW